MTMERWRFFALNSTPYTQMLKRERLDAFPDSTWVSGTLNLALSQQKQNYQVLSLELVTYGTGDLQSSLCCHQNFD